MENFSLNFANSAARVQEIANQMAAINREEARKESILVKGAEANIEQTELLEQQLDAVKEQNLQLKENYSLLKEMYEQAKQDAIDSAKVARANKNFGWVSFGVGTFIGIIGIVFGIIF